MTARERHLAFRITWTRWRRLLKSVWSIYLQLSAPAWGMVHRSSDSRGTRKRSRVRRVLVWRALLQGALASGLGFGGFRIWVIAAEGGSPRIRSPTADTHRRPENSICDGLNRWRLRRGVRRLSGRHAMIHDDWLLTRGRHVVIFTRMYERTLDEAICELRAKAKGAGVPSPQTAEGVWEHRLDCVRGLRGHFREPRYTSADPFLLCARRVRPHARSVPHRFRCALLVLSGALGGGTLGAGANFAGSVWTSALD